MPDRLKFEWTIFDEEAERVNYRDIEISDVRCCEYDNRSFELPYNCIEKSFDKQFISIYTGFAPDSKVNLKILEVTYTDGKKDRIAYSDVAYLCNSNGKTIRIYRVLDE